MYNLLTYNQALDLTRSNEDSFYESKFIVDGFNISIFNYRLAQYSDFRDNSAFEVRGLTYVFNSDGTLYKRYLLLHKFFNLNQVEETQYSLIKDLKIKSVYNKEDGSIASFIRLPNGRVIAKSKMSFESDQAVGMMRLYNSNRELRDFVNWTLDNDLIAIFEYVSPQNRIVLRYSNEELILLRLRDNKTGEYLDLSNYSDKIGSIKITPSEVGTLDELIELAHSVEDKEGWIVQFENDLFIKIKTQWYFERHGLLTNDLWREHIIVGYILDEKIDDVLGQVPEEEVEAHSRIEKIISIVKREINNLVSRMNSTYSEFVKSGADKRGYSINHKIGNPNFHYVMSMDKGERLKSMSKEDVLEYYDSIEDWEKAIERCQPYNLAVETIRDKTKKLHIARDFLKLRDPSLFFIDKELDEND